MWDAETQHLFRTFRGHIDTIHGIALRPDGTVRWTTTLLSNATAPPTHGAGNIVYVGTMLGDIIALSLDDGSARAARAGPESAAGGVAERDEEIRQMLEARNARRARQGKEPIDIEAEIARLQAPAVDPALRGEIRQLVEARNARRARQGKEPLDVEDEIERELRDLGR